jgi:hypothetical protein
VKKVFGKFFEDFIEIIMDFIEINTVGMKIWWGK